MAYGQYGAQPVAASMATDASFSAIADIRGANRVAVELPVFTPLAAGTAYVTFQVSDREAGPFQTLYAMGVYSSASGIAPYEIPTTGGSITVDTPPLAGHAFVRVQLSTACTQPYTPVFHVLM